LVRLLYFTRAALASVRASPFVHGVAALTVAAALFASALARFAVGAGSRALDAWGHDLELTLYLEGDVSPEAAQALAGRLMAEEGSSAEVVTPEQALARLRSELGDSGAVLSNLPKNPLPASIEARPPAGRRSAAQIAELAARAAALPGVASVEYGRDWIERLELLGKAARGAGALAVAVALLCAVVVVAAALQLAIYARREEIEIQKLVGASDAFVKAPFLIEGVLQGLFGACLAAAGLFASARHLGPSLSRALAFALSGLALPPLADGRAFLELLGAGAALGFAGSLLAVRRFLRV
jgi:cell division transport system permease protein